MPSVGLEANPVVHFAASVKTDWSVDPSGLREFAHAVAQETRNRLEDQELFDGPLFRTVNGPLKLRTLDPERERLLIKNSISPLPLHKVLTLLEVIETKKPSPYYRHVRLALAKQLVTSIGNLRFGPEVGVGKIKQNAPVLQEWLAAVESMASDLEQVRHLPSTTTRVIHGDARQAKALIEHASIDAVITSPPYPNEKDYSRTTRLESVLLGFMTTRQELRQQKKRFVRSNTRSVYKDDEDDRWIQDIPRIIELADQVERRRIELGKTSGFEKQYARVVRLYFGGMARHLEEMKPLLRPGAKLAYVVGDQASYLQVIIRTGELLAEIAERQGYEILDIDLFRTRFSTVTREHLREEVVLLQWSGA